jgi:hypothetical protein
VQFTNRRTSFGFYTEAVGSGTPGTEPVYGRIFTDGGMTKTSVTLTAKVSGRKALGANTGAFSYVVASGGSAKCMRKVTIECTTPGGTGVAAFTVSAPATGAGDIAETAYNATGVVMTTGSAFALSNSATITPTITTNFVVGDKWVFDVGPTRIVYQPTSDRDNHSSGIYHFHQDANRWVVTGARTSIGFDAGMLDFARFNFSPMGLWATPTAQTLPTVDYSSFQEPEIVEYENTWLFELHGYACKMKSFKINDFNQVEIVNRVGRKEVRSSGRQITGNCVIEAPTLAAKNYFSAVESYTRDSLRFCHGTKTGKAFEIRGDAVQLKPVKIENDRSDAMFNIDLIFTPVDTTIGDDEIQFIF